MPWDERIDEPRWEERPYKARKFVDDIKGRERHSTNNGKFTCTTKKEQRLLYASSTESFVWSVKKNAAAMGMVTNQKKTHLLCVNTAINSDVWSFIEIDGKVLRSEDSLKVVGFSFGRRPGAKEHIRQIRRKMANIHG